MILKWRQISEVIVACLQDSHGNGGVILEAMIMFALAAVAALQWKVLRPARA